MADEPQAMSIQQRIAALKQAQTGHSPEAATPPFLGSQPTSLPSRPAPSRNQTINNPPADAPPPPYEEVQRKPAVRPPPPAPPIGQKPKVPPPLPSRKCSTQSAPALPPRRPSEISRKTSLESVASDASRSTSTSAGRTPGTSATSIDSGSVRGVRAPAWGEAELPPLPPKRQEQTSRSRPSTANSSRSRSQSRPSLPARRESTNSTSTDGGSSVSQPPPPLPSRGNRDKSPGVNAEPAARPPPRKLPPPPPSNNVLEKIQKSGLGGINKNSEAPDSAPPPVSRPPSSNGLLGRLQNSGFGGITKIPEVPERSSGEPAQEHPSNGVPPPVPLASRPDLSKIMATKPRMQGNGLPAATPSVACLKCRDFSAPDAHAAQYPRQSLPTHDMAWLARELTAPFPSHTDKARALFTWFHHNIEYDVHSFFNNCVKPSTPGGTLASGLAVCEGYAGLFAALATHAGMEAMVIPGHGKGFGYNAPAPGSSLPPFKASHAWNVVRIDNGQWKLLDACWGAGVVQGAGQPYKKLFNSAMFTDSNDEFGLRHYPSDRGRFYRDDGRPDISWEEYLLGNPNSPLGAEQPMIFTDAKKHSIGERSFRPDAKQISVQQPGPIRFQFGLICEHWTLANHSRAKPGLFLLMVHGVDGRKDDRLPFTHARGPGPNGGGDVWYVDVLDARVLGAPGQKLQIAVLTTFGDQKDARGVTAEEYRRQVGRVGMSWAYIAEWQLV
ncbi:uncharacterized protein LDX57_002726 [Aspergillus melleus]|uniref:uncharacterized protein n=1 Tax=Aspergillus melleus TaxID=138277 RepID=UPI001E8E9330|nr:uncharacterized protein LDX57_002726 [Aspergillus melleus]KAH8424980.1 hypothetical protein LDX57_002726 [Aspergillus melleus]